MTTAIFLIENYIAGGSDKFARVLLEQLPFRKVYLFANARNDFSVLRPDELPDRTELVKYGLPTIYELGAFALKWRRVKPLFYLLRLFNAIVRYPLIFWSVLYFYMHFRRLGSDIFVANNGGYPGGEYCRSATLAASLLLKKVRVFHIFHNMPTSPKLGILKPLERCYDALIDGRSRLVCVSDATRVEMGRKRNIKQDITLIYNGIEERTIKKYSRPALLKLLNIGYYGSRKNQKMLIDAVRKVVAKGGKSVRLYLVGQAGEPEYAQSLRNFVAENGLEEYVSFEGFRRDVYGYYYDCDVFLLASSVESFPLVVLEAMSVGMPVITTPAGGTPEQVKDAVNGFVVGHDDAEAMAEKIIFFMEHPSEMEAFGRKGRELCACLFSRDAMLNSYSRLFGLKDV